MIPYSLHVAILLAVCLLFYKLLLQKETYYRLNRAVLLTCLALAFALPLIPVPQRFSLRSTEPTRVAAALPQEAFNARPAAPVNSSPQPRATVAKSAPAKTQKLPNPSSTLSKPVGQPVQKQTSFQMPSLATLLKWAFMAYWCGVAVFGINLLIQVIALLVQAYKKPSIKDGIYRIVELDTDKAPCSFGKSIYINPEKYDWETYNQILLHEKVHIRQGHTVDLILAELMLIVQWFNPFAWLYRKELESNLEFLTDDSVLHDHGVEAEGYAMSLLKVSIPNFSMRVTTNYNQSLLKKRIVMMNAKRSNIHTMWKYFMLMPLLAVLVCGLNKPTAAVAQQIYYSNGNNMRSNIDFSHGVWFANIKNDRINIEFRADDNDENHNWISSHTFDLKDFPNLPKGDKADFTLTREAGTVVFNGKFDGDQGYGHYKFTVNADMKAYVAKAKIDDIDSDDDYFSFFMANVTKSYLEFLANNGFKDLRKGQIMSMAYQHIDADYIKSWKDLGYKDLTAQQLTSLKSLKVDAAYVNDLKKAGYADLTVQQLISFKSQHITADYINGLKKASLNVKGAPELTPRDIISAKAQHVDSAYVSGFANSSTTVSSYNQLSSFKSMNITPEFIKSFEAVGMSNLSPNELYSLKSLNITPEYVKGFKDLGYSNDDIKKLLPMRRSGITPEYIKSFEAVGYKNIPVNSVYSLSSAKVTPDDVIGYVALGYTPATVTVTGRGGMYNDAVATAGGTYSAVKLDNLAVTLNDVASFKQQGITPELVKSFQDLGYKDIPLTNVRSLKAMGITPELVKSFQAVGMKDVPLNNLYQLKSVSPEYIKAMKDAGYKDLNILQYASLKRQDITPEFVAGFVKLGFTDLSSQQLSYAKMNGVTPEFVTEMKHKGFDSKDLQKYVQLKNFNSDNDTRTKQNIRVVPAQMLYKDNK